MRTIRKPNIKWNVRELKIPNQNKCAAGFAMSSWSDVYLIGILCKSFVKIVIIHLIWWRMAIFWPHHSFACYFNSTNFFINTHTKIHKHTLEHLFAVNGVDYCQRNANDRANSISVTRIVGCCWVSWSFVGLSDCWFIKRRFQSHSNFSGNLWISLFLSVEFVIISVFFFIWII